MALRNSKRGKFAAIAGAVLAPTIATAVPASAGSGGASGPGCNVTFGNSTSTDNAWSVLNSGNCGTLSVRHQCYASGGPYWTNWRTGNTLTQPQLTSSQHKATISGVTYTYNVSA
ncbi:hypothetical protein [Demequina sp.]|uniref:hypothetical protein n=1 Tax=Demequina sp. TaxID=2050685 RepID=UPI003D0A7CF2